MQIACDVIYSRIMNTSYILQSMKYHSNEPAEFIQILHEYSKVVVVVLKHIREKIG